MIVLHVLANLAFGIILVVGILFVAYTATKYADKIAKFFGIDLTKL